MTAADTPDKLRRAAPHLAYPLIAAAVFAGEERHPTHMQAFTARDVHAFAGAAF